MSVDIALPILYGNCDTTHTFPVLDGTQVARQLLTIMHTVCKEWLDQFPPLTAPADKLELSMFGIKNTRRKMEDRYALCLDVNSLYRLQVRTLFSALHNRLYPTPPRECQLRITMRCVMVIMERQLLCTPVSTC